MKTKNYGFTLVLVISLLITACQPPADTSSTEAKEAFEKNSQTVKTMIENWEKETVDYSIFADDYISVSTSFGNRDTTTLEQMKEMDKTFLAAYDFEFVTEPLNLLPGVNPDSKEMDGSVRYYGEWKVTKPATDSTEAKSGMLAIYVAYVFNKEGKIIQDLGYGDFTALINYLNN